MLEMFKRAAVALLLLTFCALLPTRLQAQVVTADVVGTVTDATGGVLPGATVTILNTGTGIAKTTTTSGSGDYVFTLLQVGSYSIKVEAKGFRTYTASGIALSSGDRARLDARLEVGEASQTIEVSGTAAPALQTDSATVGTLVTSQAVQDVPLDGRNITSLVQLAQGVNQGLPNDLMSGKRPDDRRETASFSANGQAENVNNLMVDGMDNNDRIIGTTVLRPSIDAIQEVNVSTNLYDASATRSAGAVVDIITKSGSNGFHGSAYEFFRNAVLNANQTHQTPAGCPSGNNAPVCTISNVIMTPAQPKGAFRQNQYGASLGGPIKKDKAFFFVDLEKFNQAVGVPLVSTVPTLCERGLAPCPDSGGVNPAGPGDFSDVLPISAPVPNNNQACVFGTPGANQQQYGTPGCPYVNLVGSPALTSIGAAYFNMYPKPNSSALTNNYASDPARTQSQTTFDTRIDYHFSESDSLFGRYSFNDATTVTPDAFPAVTVNGVSVQPGGWLFNGPNNFPGPAKERAQAVVLSYVHVFSPQLILNLKGGFDRLADNSLSVNAGSSAASKAFGFPCNSVSCVNFGPLTASGIPNVSMPGYTNLGDAIFLPIIYYDTTFQYSGVLTWVKGSQSIRVGASLIRRRATQGQSNSPNGGWEFTGGYTGQPLGDLLEGLSARGGGAIQSSGSFFSVGLRQFALVQSGLRNWEPGVFVQDDWRARHWLTLNLGARYDIFTPSTEKLGRLTNWNPANGYMQGISLPGMQQSGATAGINTFYRAFAPRIGFAATLKHNFVVRGGFGISFYQTTVGPTKNAPYAFNSNCAAQNAQGSNTTCLAPFAQSAVVQYGASGSTSQVGFSGGVYMPAGTPLPTLDITTVLPQATCTASTPANAAGCTVAGGNAYAKIGSITATWPNYPAPYLEQYSLQVQKELKGNVIQLGYVGEFGRHQGGTIPFTSVVSTAESLALKNAHLANPLAAQYPWLNFNTISAGARLTTSSYNALQASFVRRFKDGLTVNVNYTWMHELTNGGGSCTPVYSPADFGYGSGAQYIYPCYFDNPASPSSPFAVSDLVNGPGRTGNASVDVPNRIAGSVNYQLPFGKNAKGLRGLATKGWATNFAGYWQSGLPFSVTNGDARNVADSKYVFSGAPIAAVGGGLNQTCSGKAANPTIVQWIDPTCFSQPTISTWGTAASNQMFGPRQRNLDFSMFKTFDLTERLHLQFRTEIFNILNVVNYAPPGGTPGTNSGSVAIPWFSGACTDGNPGGQCGAGTPVKTQGDGKLPEGAVTSLNPSANAREIQFALKFLF